MTDEDTESGGSTLKVYSPFEILALSDLRGGWGSWQLRSDNLTVEHAEHHYGVDLERCRTPADVLDWIAQVAHKQWATAEVVYGLVRILDDVLGFQARMQDHRPISDIELEGMVDRVEAELARGDVDI